MSDDTNDQGSNASRRSFIKTGVVTGATVAAGAVAGASSAKAAADPYAEPADPMLPPSTVALDLSRTGLVVTDPQNDFLHETGVAWGAVGESVTEHNTVANLGRLFTAAKAANVKRFISPHYYFPTDRGWKFEGALEKLMHNIDMFQRTAPLSLDGFEGSGADFLEIFKADILDGETVITSPHKVYGPEQNDLVLQLRKRHIDQVILAGMSANLCVEAHMRELLEQGFEVIVVRDATAGAKLPDGDGYLAALINFRYMANAVWSTDETIERLRSA